MRKFCEHIIIGIMLSAVIHRNRRGIYVAATSENPAYLSCGFAQEEKSYSECREGEGKSSASCVREEEGKSVVDLAKKQPTESENVDIDASGYAVPTVFSSPHPT